jgi:hypothetical protein
MMGDRKESRREVVKKMAYVAPIVLSLAASPAFARNGSGTGSPCPPEGCSPV